MKPPGEFWNPSHMGPAAISADVGNIPLVFQNYKMSRYGVQFKNLKCPDSIDYSEIYKRLKIGGESL